jgi:hypothetical protein
MPLRRSFVLVLISMTLAGRAEAVEIGDEDAPASVEVHAFVSQGFILSKDNNYIDTNSSRGSLQYSELGINFTKRIGDKLRVGMQLFAQDLGPTGNYNAKLDWAYLDYRLTDWLGFRAGRVKVPFGLYNEIQDVDSARTFVLLPQSVYPIENVDYLLAQTGAEVYGYLKLGGAGALDYRAYGGTLYFSEPAQPGSPYQIVAVNTPFLFGGRLLWETPLEGLRLGASLQTLRIDLQLLSNTAFDVEVPATLWVGSVEYAAHDFVAAAEYSRWNVKIDSNNAGAFPSSPLTTSERAYGMLTYRAAKWLQPGAYYSVMFPDVDERGGRQNYQHDIATTLRFDITQNWLFKLEGHYMIGTAGLTSSLNDNVPLSELERSWGVFLAKTTAYF